MSFEAELARVLPADLPHRGAVIAQCARHLAMVEEANRYMNLTRITNATEAAVKHVLDSVQPWRLFSGAAQVLDAGTGAGFPGIPLALALPEVRFTLCESVQKRARFVEFAVTTLGLGNVEVQPVRAEEYLKRNAIPLVTTRALAPLAKTLQLFAPALDRGARILLYKGPDAAAEMEQAAAEARRRRVRMNVVMQYELPENMGRRSVVELSR